MVQRVPHVVSHLAIAERRARNGVPDVPAARHNLDHMRRTYVHVTRDLQGTQERGAGLFARICASTLVIRCDTQFLRLANAPGDAVG